MPTCKLSRVCGEIKRTLRRCGADHDIDDTCTGDGFCSAAINNARKLYHYVNTDTAKYVTKSIQKIFGGEFPIDRSTTVLDLAFNKPPFKCPELDINVRQPCSVSSCAFWTAREWTRNCIIYYMVDQNREGLDLKDLTILLGEETNSVRKRWNAAIALSSHRGMELKAEQAKKETEDPPLDQQESDANVCAACGQEAGEDSFIRSGFTYCSDECFTARPPVELQLEQEFKLPIKRILQVCHSTFYARRPMRHALGVSNPQLDALFSSHQIDISSLP